MTHQGTAHERELMGDFGGDAVGAQRVFEGDVPSAGEERRRRHGRSVTRNAASVQRGSPFPHCRNISSANPALRDAVNADWMTML